MFPTDPEHEQYDDGLISEYNEDVDLGEIPEEDVKEIIDEGSLVGDDMEVVMEEGRQEAQDNELGLGELCLHDGEPSYSLSLHADGKLIASGGGNDRAVLISINKDDQGHVFVNLLGELEGHSDTVEQVLFSPQGDMLATGSLDGSVRVYKVEDEKAQILHILEGPTEILWLDWHPRNGQLAAGSNDGSVWIWDGAKGECLAVLSGSTASSFCGKFSLDGKYLVVGATGCVLVWNLQGDNAYDRAHLTYTGNTVPSGDALSLAIHQSQPIAAVGFDDGHLLLIHLAHYQVLFNSTLGSEPLERVAFVPTHPMIIVASLDGTITIIDSNNFKVRSTMRDDRLAGGISTIKIIDKGTMLLAGSVNGCIGMWDARSGETKQIIPEPSSLDDEQNETNAIFDFVEVCRHRLVLASYDDGKIRIFPY